MTSAPDPKPRKRVTDTKAGRMKVLQERECRLCRRQDRPVGRHHLVGRAQGGDDDEDNIVPLCALCHDELHHGKNSLRKRLELGLRLTDRERAYCVARRGEHWLERTYGGGKG